MYFPKARVKVCSTMGKFFSRSATHMSIGEEVVRVRSPAGPWEHQIVNLINNYNTGAVSVTMARGCSGKPG